MKKFIEKIPTWAICAIINDDYTGLTDREVASIREWLDVNDYTIIAPPRDGDEPFFSWCPAIGTATDVYECECIIL